MTKNKKMEFLKNFFPIHNVERYVQNTLKTKKVNIQFYFVSLVQKKLSVKDLDHVRKPGLVRRQEKWSTTCLLCLSRSISIKRFKWYKK